MHERTTEELARQDRMQHCGKRFKCGMDKKVLALVTVLSTVAAFGSAIEITKPATTNNDKLQSEFGQPDITIPSKVELFTSHTLIRSSD
jgi:hypothetical protein